MSLKAIFLSAEVKGVMTLKTKLIVRRNIGWDVAGTYPVE